MGWHEADGHPSDKLSIITADAATRDGLSSTAGGATQTGLSSAADETAATNDEWSFMRRRRSRRRSTPGLFTRITSAKDKDTGAWDVPCVQCALWCTSLCKLDNELRKCCGLEPINWHRRRSNAVDLVLS